MYQESSVATRPWIGRSFGIAENSGRPARMARCVRLIWSKALPRVRVDVLLGARDIAVVAYGDRDLQLPQVTVLGGAAESVPQVRLVLQQLPDLPQDHICCRALQSPGSAPCQPACQLSADSPGLP